jgi:hypothetical protein
MQQLQEQAAALEIARLCAGCTVCSHEQERLTASAPASAGI